MIKHQRHLHLSTFILCATIMLGLSSCGPNGNDKPSNSKQQNAEVNLHRQDSTSQYKFDIQLPEIIRTNAVLRDTLTKLADRQQQSFTNRASNDSMQTERPPWELQLMVTTQDSTSHFISVLAEGYEYMGGAHGAPFFITLNYDREEQRFVTLRDMLGDSTALVPISEYARQELAKELGNTTPMGNDTAFMEGTAPSYGNYKNVLVQPQGIQIIFGSYQVGPYAIGTPEVDVPASVFRDKLKDGYTDWFTSESEAEQGGE